MNPFDVSDHSDFSLTPRPRRGPGGDHGIDRPVCRVVPLKPEPRLLETYLPEIRFAVDDTEPADWIWACGYEPGDFDRVLGLRNVHPGTRFLVTGRRLGPELRTDLSRAGVDVVLDWPQPLRALRDRLVSS
ncbi:MAG: hypothetical protein R3F34_08605 [Planctomycetota bacterium]